jgi:hypothetical protein
MIVRRVSRPRFAFLARMTERMSGTRHRFATFASPFSSPLRQGMHTANSPVFDTIVNRLSHVRLAASRFDESVN